MSRLERQMVVALRNCLAGAPCRIPEAGALAWGWFVDLCGTRSYGSAGADPITYAQIEAYARLMRWPMEPRHVEVIRALDKAWLAHVRQQQRGGAEVIPRSSGQAVSPDAFDAVFG